MASFSFTDKLKPVISQHVNIRTQIMALVGMLVGLGAVVWFFALLELSQIRKEMHELVALDLPSVLEASHLSTAYQRQAIELERIIQLYQIDRYDDDIQGQLYLDKFQYQKKKTILDNRMRHLSGLIDSTSTKDLSKEAAINLEKLKGGLSTIQSSLDRYNLLGNQLLSLASEGRYEKAADAVREIEDLHVFIAQQFEILEAQNERFLLAASHAAEMHVIDLYKQLLLSLLLIALIGYFFGSRIIRNITTPLRQVTACLLALCRGDTTIDIPKKQNGELGILTRAITLFRDGILREKEHEKKLVKLALHDSLTNLPNRAYFNHRLEEEIIKADRNHEMLAVILLDLDYFKNINDTFGHPVGDALLKEFAERLKKGFRKTDTVARLGGDEFALILSNIRRHSEITMYKRIIKQAADKEFLLEGKELSIGVTAGISVFENACSADEMVRRADIALYDAKRKGRGNVSFFSKKLNQLAHKNLMMENDLRRAIKQKQFHLVYQPQYCLNTNKIVGVECLLRWNHPEHGMMMPDKFIQFAEENNLIVSLSQWVIEESIDHFCRIKEETGHDLTMAINLSAKELRQKSLIDQLSQMTIDKGIDREFIELELTENSILNDEAAKAAQSLRKRGFKVAIDDFGTGYSSLGRLMNFPVDRLKIDRSFIANLSDGRQSVVIVEMIIKLARAFSMTVIAEGVENEGQVEFLKSRGCDQAQGFYYSKPLPLEALIDLVKTRPSDVKQITTVNDAIILFKPYLKTSKPIITG